VASRSEDHRFHTGPDAEAAIRDERKPIAISPSAPIGCVGELAAQRYGFPAPRARSTTLFSALQARRRESHRTGPPACVSSFGREHELSRSFESRRDEIDAREHSSSW